MEKVKILNAGRSITVTSASPIICSCEDGNRYYTKFYEGVEGPRELINEFIGYNIAKILKLPIPDAALLEPDISTNFYIAGLQKSINSNHLAFGSREVPKVMSVIDDEIFKVCKNKGDFLAIILFDHIVGNQDRERNVGNLLFRIKDKIMFIIDHGRIFDVGTIWNATTCRQKKNEIIIKDLTNDTLYGKMLNEISIDNDKINCILRFKNLTRDKIEKVFEAIPNEWECSPEEKESAIDFIMYRLEKIEYIIEEIKKKRGE